MSKTHIEKIKCPECGAETEFLVWETMNTEIDPEVFDNIRNGDAFKWHCSGCDNKSLLFYPTIYHQVQDKFLISFVPGNTDSAVSYMKDVEKGNISGYDFGTGYTKRVVGDINQLREKLVILDDGLDDRILELMKLFIIADVQNKNPDVKIAEMFFNKDSSGERSFAIRFDNDKWGSSSFVRESYDQIEQTFMTALAADDEVLIDLEWAMDFLDKNT